MGAVEFVDAPGSAQRTVALDPCDLFGVLEKPDSRVGKNAASAEKFGRPAGGYGVVGDNRREAKESPRSALWPAGSSQGVQPLDGWRARRALAPC